MVRNRVEASWWQRLVQHAVSTRLGSWILSHVLHHVDRVLMGVSGGRLSTPKILAGIPTVRLTTTGAKTGEERTVPLLGLRDGEKWVVIASNWGSERHPNWYYNLRSDPEVKLTYDGRTEPYVARDATDDEWETYWSQARDVYVGFDAYERRSGDRRIPIVVLEPDESRDVDADWDSPR